MGVFRFFLAIAVIFNHTAPFLGIKIMPGSMAVEMFFMISGFYMSLILSEKYTGAGSYKLFITNRALKLYPAYFAVSIITIIISVAYYSIGKATSLTQSFTFNYNLIDAFSYFILFITNTLIIGQDLIMFLCINKLDGSMFFTSNFRNHDLAAYHFMVNPQAWSISIEMVFYAIAPFIVRRSILIISLLALSSYILKYILVYNFNLNNDPWTYRFFPSELQFFMVGVLSYRIYVICKNIKTKQLKIITAITVLGLAFSISLINNPGIGNEIKNALCFSFAFLCLPFLFLISKDSNMDKKIGELSYPMYLSHLVVVLLTKEFIDKSGTLDYQAPIVLFFTVVISLIINSLIVNPIESIRQRRVPIH